MHLVSESDSSSDIPYVRVASETFEETPRESVLELVAIIVCMVATAVFLFCAFVPWAAQTVPFYAMNLVVIVGSGFWAEAERANVAKLASLKRGDEVLRDAIDSNDEGNGVNSFQMQMLEITTSRMADYLNMESNSQSHRPSTLGQISSKMARIFDRFFQLTERQAQEVEGFRQRLEESATREQYYKMQSESSRDEIVSLNSEITVLKEAEQDDVGFSASDLRRCSTKPASVMAEAAGAAQSSVFGENDNGENDSASSLASKSSAGTNQYPSTPLQDRDEAGNE